MSDFSLSGSLSIDFSDDERAAREPQSAALSGTQPRMQFASGTKPQLSVTSLVPAPTSRPRPAYGLTSMPDVAFSPSNASPGRKTSVIRATSKGKVSVTGTPSVGSSASSDISISFSDDEEPEPSNRTPWRGAHSDTSATPQKLTATASEIMRLEKTLTKAESASDGRSSPDEESFSIEFSDMESSASGGSDVNMQPALVAVAADPDNSSNAKPRPDLGSRGQTVTDSSSGVLTGSMTRVQHPTKPVGGASRLGVMSLASQPSGGSSSATPEISSSGSEASERRRPPVARLVMQPSRPVHSTARASRRSSGSSSGPAVKLGDMSDLMDMLADDYVPDVEVQHRKSSSALSSSRSRGSSSTGGSGSRPVTVPSSAGSPDSDSGSDNYRPRIMTVEDLEVMSDASASSNLEPDTRDPSSYHTSAASSAASPASSSTASEEYHPKLLTVDALEAMSLAGSSKVDWDRSSHSSDSHGGSATVSSPSTSDTSTSHSRGSSRDDGRPRIMTMADLPSIKEIEHALQGSVSGSQLASSKSYRNSNQSGSDRASDEQHRGGAHVDDGGDVDGLLAGMVMVRQGGDSSTESSDSAERLGLRRSDAELWPIKEGDTSHYVTSASHSSSRSSDVMESQTGTQLAATQRMLNRQPDLDHDKSRSGDMSEMLGVRAPTWTTSVAGNAGSAAKQQIVEEWAAPYSVGSPHGCSMPHRADYQPLPGVTSFSGAPAVVFGVQHPPNQPRSNGVQSQPVVDLSPRTNSCLLGGVRSVCVQVGSMNEVATQVAYDAARGKLVEGVTAGPLVYPPGLQGLMGTSQSSRAQQLVSVAAAPGPWQDVQGWLASGHCGHAPPPMTALGSLENALASSLHWHQKAGPQMGVAPGAAAVLGGGGWGLLSCAVQNLKAAALLEQLETVSGHIKGAAEVAKLAIDVPSTISLPKGQAVSTAIDPHQLGAGSSTRGLHSSVQPLSHKLGRDASNASTAHASPFAIAIKRQGEVVPQLGREQDAAREVLSGEASQAAQTISDDTYTESFETEASGSQQDGLVHSLTEYHHKTSACQPPASSRKGGNPSPQGGHDRQAAGLQGRCSSRSLAASMSGVERLACQGVLHGTTADPCSMSVSSGGPSHHVSIRRQSTVGEQLLIPEHNHMDILPRRSTGASRPITAQVHTKSPVSQDGGQHLTMQLDALPHLPLSTHYAAVAGAHPSGAPVEVQHASASTEEAPTHQQHMDAAARDTLLRYHALLSTGAVPGGLLDSSSIARMRAELVAGAAAAAATSGLGMAEVLKESSDHSTFKQQVMKLKGQLAATCTVPFIGAQTQPVKGWPTGCTSSATASEGRHVILDRISFGRPALVDVGGYTRFKYTTLEDTMQFIRAYQPPRLS